MSKYEVDIDLANAAKKNMAKIMDLKNPRVLNKVGAFSSLYDITFPEYKEPVMVLKTEEPGSKQLLARSRSYVVLLILLKINCNYRLPAFCKIQRLHL